MEPTVRSDSPLMNADGRLRAAVIGLGVGEQHILGYQSVPGCSVVAVCDKDPERLTTVAQRRRIPVTEEDPARILARDDVDVVSIATYDDSHADLVVEAIMREKHIFVEKPLCLTDTDLSRIVAVHRQHPQVRLGSNLILRMAPRFVDLRERVAAGRLGTIYAVEASYDYGRMSKLVSGWRATCPGYAVMHGGGIHLLDLALWLTDARVLSVQAMGTRLGFEAGAYRSHHYATGQFATSTGAILTIKANFGSVTPHHHRLNVYGTEGTFEQAHMGAQYLWSRGEDARAEALSDPYPSVSKGALAAAFVSEILEGRDPQVSAAEIVHAMAASLAAERSILSGHVEQPRF